MVSEYFAGPIAHPRHLRAYEEIQPGSADRIIRMAEARNEHIIAMEAKIADAEIADQKRGMWLGGALFASLIGAALLSALSELGALVVGLFLGAAAIGGVAVFVKGRNGSAKD